MSVCRRQGKFVVDGGFYGPGETEQDGDRRFDRLVDLKIDQLYHFVEQAQPDTQPNWRRFSDVLLDLVVTTIRTTLQAQILYLRRRRDGLSELPVGPAARLINH